ncbi:MAG TPA: hypothetical protein VMW62_02705 [Chloroflexota bacterium]|nr:hypothetical protein [Chloroflexota bacterium]
MGFDALDGCDEALACGLAAIVCPQLANNNGNVSQKAGRIWIIETPGDSFGQR